MKARQNPKAFGKKRIKTIALNSLAVIAVAIPLVLVALNIYHQEKADAAKSAATDLPNEAELIDPASVCMATNVYMGANQMAHAHGGDTYYACSNHCIKRLTENSEDRYAIDPVSNNRVNKAAAIICAHPDRSGTIYYFESKENHLAFLEQNASQQKNRPATGSLK